MRVTAEGVSDGPGGRSLDWGDLDRLRAIANKAVDSFLGPHSIDEEEERDDLAQEGLTWLLEYPGRAWVRAVDGTMEDPEEQLVADLVEHLQRTF